MALEPASSHGSHRRKAASWVAIALALTAPLLFCLPGAAAWAQYDRVAVAGGQYWRLITCHWAHWSFDHLFWSGGVFTLLAIVTYRISARRLMAFLLISVAAISAAVQHWTDLHFYRGLSGIDSALFAWIALEMLRNGLARGRTFEVGLSATLLIGFAGKIAYEAAVGGAIFVDSEVAQMLSVPLAHFVGAAVGVAVGLLHPLQLPIRSRWTKMPFEEANVRNGIDCGG